MARGLPDYYNPDTVVSQRLANVEELVTQMRGVASLDNRGMTYYYTHFREGVSDLYLLKQGDGVNPAACITEAEVAPASCFMDAGTDSGGGKSIFRKQFHIRTVKRAGLEFSIALLRGAVRLSALMGYDSDTLRGHGSVRVDIGADTVSIIDNITAETVYTFAAPGVTETWLPLKMVIDFETLEYVRLLIGQEQYDISVYSPYQGAVVDPGLLRIFFSAEPLDDATNYVYIGHLALTLDEP